MTDWTDYFPCDAIGKGKQCWMNVGFKPHILLKYILCTLWQKYNECSVVLGHANSILSLTGETMKHLGLLGCNKKIWISIKILQTFKSCLPVWKPKFDLESWFAMDFQQSMFLKSWLSTLLWYTNINTSV